MTRMTKPKNCANCKMPLDADGKFCKECGTLIEPVIVDLFCINCGKRHGESDKFCRFCSFDLVKAREEMQTLDNNAIPMPEADWTQKQSNPATAQTISTQHIANEQNRNDFSLETPELVPQADLQTVENENTQDNPASYISPSGAAFVVICFFLPWLEWSACGIRKTASGAELSQFDGSFLLFPLAGIVSFAAYFIAKGQKKIWKARPFIIISSALGLFLMFYKVNSIPSSPEIFGQRITASDLGFKPQIGGIGTIIGFILAMIGCAFMKTAKSFGEVIASFPTSQKTFPKEIKFDLVSGKHKLLAVSCFLTPAFIPLIFLIFNRNSNLIRSDELGLIIILVLIFSLQIYLIKFSIYKNDLYIRHQAFASIFYFIFYVIAGFLGFQISALLLFPSIPFLEVIYRVLIPVDMKPQFSLPLLFFQWIVPIFLAVKAYQGKFYKLPYLGDWAIEKAAINTNEHENVSKFIEAKNQSVAVSHQPIQSFLQTPNDNVKISDDSKLKDLLQRKSVSDEPITITISDSKKSENPAETTETDLPENFLEKTTATSVLNREAKIMLGVLIGVVVLMGFVFYSLNKTNYTAVQNNLSQPGSSSNTNITNTTANTKVNSNMSSGYTANNYQSFSNSSANGKTGRLTTDLNIRDAPNKNAYSLGIHFRDAKVVVLEETSYELDGAVSTWYKIRVTEFGCSVDGNLGCGKNSPSDSDEGWVNAKYIFLD